MKVSIFVPSHITGFFTITNDNNPLKKGSCGAGVLLDKGVVTTVKSSKKEDIVDIKINGKRDLENEIISKRTIDLIKKDFNIREGIKINHDIEVPIGSGFGTSASCALGIAISIFKLFDFDINDSYIKASQYAHIAEVELGSGLGDVIAELSKGIVFREKNGGPGFGVTKNICSDDKLRELYVITKTLGKIDTADIIQDPIYQQKINDIGLNTLKKFKNNSTIENFLNYSYDFAKDTGLMNEELLRIVEDFKNYTIGSSMAMLGNTAFALSNEPYCDIKDSIISKIDIDGIKFL